MGRAEVKMYTQEQIQEVVNIDLYDFALKNLDAVKEGNWARLRSNKSVCFKRGSSRYIDFAMQGKGSSGNLIDLLTTYYGETFKSVMESQIGADASSYKRSEIDYVSNYELPIKAKSFKETMAYLCITRRIPGEVIARLIKKELIYQSCITQGYKRFCNCVFVNDTQSYYEIHGTLSFGKSFHGNGRKAIDEYWSFMTGNEIATVYICESAIDAISLAVIRNMDAENALYVSIGGVANYKTIERLIDKYGNKCVIAVDNDKAGQSCRDRYNTFRSIVAKHKDWNEDLMKG